MTPDKPRLLPDGGVFPPVTPDPPPPPGQEEIVVPDVVIRSEGNPEQDIAPKPEAEPEEEPPAGEPSA